MGNIKVKLEDYSKPKNITVRKKTSKVVLKNV